MMEQQDFSDLARSGTAPIGPLKGKATYASHKAASGPQGRQAARPKTSSTSDLSDLNAAFRSNRSMAALAQAERQEQAQALQNADAREGRLGPEGDALLADTVSAVFRRGQQESEFLQLRGDLASNGPREGPTDPARWDRGRGKAAGSVGHSPAARNAWGMGPRAGGGGGAGLADEGRKKGGGLSAYLESAVPVLQVRRG